MGKSDPFVFDWYLKNLPAIQPKSIAVLGSTSENFVRKAYPTAQIDLYDLQLGNWDINSNFWNIEKDCYDLVICTRCAYFSKNPLEFIERCKDLINKDGIVFIDWGLGDHWRFEDYKVGWVRNGEHEFAYNQNNFLYSCFWTKDLEEDSEVKKFWKAVKQNNFKYSDSDTLNEVVQKEVPFIVEYETKLIKTLFLWPEKPQLYIATLF